MLFPVSLWQYVMDHVVLIQLYVLCKICNTSTMHHSHTSMLFIGCVYSLHSFLEIRTVIIVIKRKECALRRPYQTRARARVISEIEEVQERMKVDMEAVKEPMTTNDGGHDEHEEDDEGQCGSSCRYQRHC